MRSRLSMDGVLWLSLHHVWLDASAKGNLGRQYVLHRHIEEHVDYGHAAF